MYIYGYLNIIQTSLCLERETQRNFELMWLTERLSPDFKTIADFRKDTIVELKTPVKHSFKCAIKAGL
jgi:transposase